MSLTTQMNHLVGVDSSAQPEETLHSFGNVMMGSVSRRMMRRFQSNNRNERYRAHASNPQRTSISDDKKMSSPDYFR